jgi:DUF4097 and DUF4098 domain-containing protein YvlB
MRNMIPLVLSALMLLSTAYGSDLKETEPIRKTVKFADQTAAHRLVVDNINGSIRVTGYTGSDVELVAYRTIRAGEKDKIEEAKQKVTLDITEKADKIVLYVNAPGRCADGGINYRGADYDGYDVEYDFELRVPVKTDVVLKTVNHGDIEVKNVQGQFEVNNVNGGIDMEDIDGSGTAATVNGSVNVRFDHNPAQSSSFRTINGKVTVELRKNLSANLRFTTMNGEVFTDFSVTDLPQSSPVHEKHGRKNIFRSGDSFCVRAGDGGPELSFDTLNGNIYVLEREAGTGRKSPD